MLFNVLAEDQQLLYPCEVFDGNGDRIKDLLRVFDSETGSAEIICQPYRVTADHDVATEKKQYTPPLRIEPRSLIVEKNDEGSYDGRSPYLGIWATGPTEEDCRRSYREALIVYLEQIRK